MAARRAVAVVLALALGLAETAYAAQTSQDVPTGPNSNGHSTTKSTTTAGAHSTPKRIVRMYTAHAILACLAWAAIFPTGGVMIRLLPFRNILRVHACLQITGYCMYIAAVGLGLKLSLNPRFYRMHDKHVIIGLTLFGLFFFQGMTGWMHHVVYKKAMGRSVWSYIHLWTGRLCITLGMINACFGFQLTHKDTSSWQVKTYSVFAVVVWVVYVISIVVGELRKRKVVKERRSGRVMMEGSRSGSEGNSGVQTPQEKEAPVVARETGVAGNEA